MARQDSTTILNERYPSDPQKRKDIIETLCKAVTSCGIDVAITPEEIYLSMDEAITNAMEHGNHWDPRKHITVTVTADRKHMRISIADEGRGFDTSGIKAVLKNRDVLSNRGRGIYIINQFSTISWNDKGNEIILQINRKK
jgi:anti-sigma regulatory factor (Ser/Thr protein kinase)